ncbi:GNAT family N-acetyltransferase [Patescibacteria group bacterium]|nr:GNAT family N-acetyltransferase [Patescibacteria group bacterium]
MTIRKFKKSDTTELSKLMIDTVLESNIKDYTKEAVNHLCEEYTSEKILIDSKKMSIFLAVEESKLLGTIALDDDLILRMFVLPKYQGKKIGKKLVHHIEDIARKRAIEKLKLRASITAYGFYKKHGYKKIKETDIKGIGKIIWMEKDLSI